MARMLVAWELGGGFGHVMRVLPLAVELRDRGHDVWVVARDLVRAELVLGRAGFPVLQAPVARSVTSRDLARGYADILGNCGYGSIESLSAILGGWRRLLDLVHPDAVVIEYAPTAALAARALGVPLVLIRQGFFVPPLTRPLPPLQPWRPASPADLAAEEAKVLATVNHVLGQAGGPPVEALTQLFDADERCLCTFAELDQFSGREGDTYLGPIFGVPEGEAPEWPPGSPDSRVFVYLSATHKEIDQVFAGLARLGVPAFGYVRDIQEGAAERFNSANVRVSPRPVAIAEAAAECRMIICHGGHGTLAQMTLAGKPALIVPQQLEHALQEFQMQRRGIGRMVDPTRAGHDYGAHVREVLNDSALAEAAAAAAAAHADYRPPGCLPEIVERCEAVAGG